MLQNDTSEAQVQGTQQSTVQPTKQATSLPYPYSHLTKAEIVSLLSGNAPAKTLTPREFTRCAISIVSRWCDAVLSGRFSSAFSVRHQLETLARIYKNR